MNRWYRGFGVTIEPAMGAPKANQRGRHVTGSRLLLVLTGALCTAGLSCAGAHLDAPKTVAPLGPIEECLEGDMASCAAHCDAGDPRGCEEAAAAYKAGVGVEVNTAAARGLLERGCELGSSRSCGDLAALLSGVRPVDVLRANELALQACEAGNADSCDLLAHAYRHGMGVEWDPAHAKELFEQACYLGSATGCSSAAYNVEFGRGTPRSAERAHGLYLKGCELGSLGACREVARGFECGHGVPKDAARALEIRGILCDAADVSSCRWLGDQLVPAVELPSWLLVRKDALKLQAHAAADAARRGRRLEESMWIVQLLQDGSDSLAQFLLAARTLNDGREDLSTDVLSMFEYDPAIAVLLELIKEPPADHWAEALLRAWNAAGRPMLAQSRFLMEGSGHEIDPCRLGVTLEQLVTADDLLVAYGNLSSEPGGFNHWGAAVPPTQELLDLARASIGSDTLAEVIVSIALLTAPGIDAQTRKGHASTARTAARQLDRQHDESVFLGLWAVIVGTDPQSPFTDEELIALEAVLERPEWGAPKGDVYDRMLAAYRARHAIDPVALAFVSTIDLLTGGPTVVLRKRASLTARVLPESRARVGRLMAHVGRRMAEASWLVEAFIAAWYLYDGARMAQDRQVWTEAADQLARTHARDSRTSSRTLWPLRKEYEESTRRTIVNELGFSDSLKHTLEEPRDGD